MFIARLILRNVPFVTQRQQILSVPALNHGFRQRFKLVGIDVSEVIRNFFGAGDHQSLPLLDGLNVHACFKERIVRASIEPCHTAAHHLYPQFAGFKIQPVQVCDFQFAARGGLNSVASFTTSLS